MGMFDNYTNLNSNYHPNNISKYVDVCMLEFDDELPHKEYNIMGKFIGYSWNFGDTPTLTFNINPIIKVESNALVYTTTGTEPTTSTAGVLGQRAYNTVDMKCWKCVTLDRSVYEWVEESSFTYPCNGAREIRLMQYPLIANMAVDIIISDFRYEEVLHINTTGNNTVQYHISSDDAEKLIKGIYNCTITVSDLTNSYSIYSSKIMIK